MEGLVAVGLGLGYEELRFERTSEAWLAAGLRLRDRVADELDALVVDVEHIGSSSVLGLLAKPIIDLAVGVGADLELPEVTGPVRLSHAAGWVSAPA